MADRAGDRHPDSRDEAGGAPPGLPRDRMSVDEELAVFLKGAAECLKVDELRDLLEKARTQRRRLRIKLGADPSAPDIHLGHTVVLWKLRQIQDLGHEVTFLIGDFTGRIGDPTGKSQTRPALTEEDVLRNAETYKQQIFKVLDPATTRIRFNSEWLSPLSFADVIRLASRATVAHMLERQDFGARYQACQPIHLHEFFYSLAQGYDSIAMETDVELGGLDQRFNFVTTRDLQKGYGQRPEVALMMPILNGTCGTQKMSKSLGNYIGIDEPPDTIFWKVMSLSDTQMWEYWTLLSDRSAVEVAGMQAAVAERAAHPMELKKDLAALLVERFHGAGTGAAARAAFRSTVQDKGLPEDIPGFPVAGLPENPIAISRLLVHCFGGSTSDARRAVKQGAVKLDGEKCGDEKAEVAVRPGMLLQMGKHRYARLVG